MRTTQSPALVHLSHAQVPVTKIGADGAAPSSGLRFVIGGRTAVSAEEAKSREISPPLRYAGKITPERKP